MFPVQEARGALSILMHCNVICCPTSSLPAPSQAPHASRPRAPFNVIRPQQRNQVPESEYSTYLESECAYPSGRLAHSMYLCSFGTPRVCFIVRK